MAVTSLLAAKGSSQIVAHFSASRLSELLQQARDILEEYEKHSTLASRCNSVLRLIEQNLDRRSSVMESDVSVEGSRSVNRRDHALAQDGFNTGQQQPQVPSSTLDMIENYTFDWNDWPVFFSELDGEDSRLQGWGELPT